jgi:PAS domain S-box-containing protein
MNDVVMVNKSLALSLAREGRAAARRAVFFSILILALAGLLSAALYVLGTKDLHERAVQVELQGGLHASETNFALLRHVDGIALSMAVLGGAGAIGSLLPLFFASAAWRRRVQAQLERHTEDWQAASDALHAQLAEARRVRDNLLQGQASLEAKIKNLAADNSRLGAEIDERNRSERALTKRRQELESSKSVLELHVQARTQELQTLQRRYEMILNSAGEGICGLDLEGRATFVNPTVAKITGWPVNELIGKTEHEIFLVNSAKGSAALNGHNPGEHVFCRRDGSRFPVEYVKTPIHENDRVVGSVLVFKDITERKRVEEDLAQKAAELARSNAELEQFAFVASHDLQEPLRKIQAFGDRLKVKCEPMQSPEIHDYLGRMQSAAARMRTLINDLLTFSRVIRSSEPFVQVDLTQVTKDVLGDLEVRIEKSHAQVELEPLPGIEADPMQMRQLMLNLVSNALKFQSPGATPVVKISGRTFDAPSGEPMCEVIVQDNGIGFDEKYVDRIFAVFQRLHGRSEYEGTGVGLAVCRRIVDRHRGNIRAHSHPSQGATFEVVLPVHQPKTEPAPK